VKVSREIASRVLAFHHQSDFARKGGVITDLDGTALHEEAGRLSVDLSVEAGLKALSEMGRPIVINTLRFPLNVIKTFGRAWSEITDEPIPLVSLNGAVLGRLTPVGEHDVEFTELEAAPLTPGEIDGVMSSLDSMLAGGLTNLLVFHYPCDWRLGELIWTPHGERIDDIADKYRSASEVFDGGIESIAKCLRTHGACMLSILADAPGDQLMAYQHGNPNRFVTHEGIDKLSGARLAADRLGFELDHSVGAGDTRMDNFLSGCGLALHLGARDLPFQGLVDTIRLPDAGAMGTVLFELSGLQILAEA
jgi:hydroxymethylpyrimidine pyrophosphatase-like HAD family hydrolase